MSRTGSEARQGASTSVPTPQESSEQGNAPLKRLRDCWECGQSQDFDTPPRVCIACGAEDPCGEAQSVEAHSPGTETAPLGLSRSATIRAARMALRRTWAFLLDIDGAPAEFLKLFSSRLGHELAQAEAQLTGNDSRTRLLREGEESRQEAGAGGPPRGLTGKERLHRIERELRARGVMDIKFSFGSLDDIPLSVVAHELADSLEAYLRGEFHPLPPAGDSTRSNARSALTRDEQRALREMLAYAEAQHGKSQQGYYSRGGWSGYTLWQLLERTENPERALREEALQEREHYLTAAALARGVAARILSAKAGHPPSSPQAGYLANAAVGAHLCALEFTQAAERLANQSGEPPVDLNLMPIGKCDRCERKVWKADTLGKIDEAKLPEGGICGGRFIPL